MQQAAHQNPAAIAVAANNPLFPWAIAAAAQQAQATALLPNTANELFITQQNAAAAALQARQMAATAAALQQFPHLFQPALPLQQTAQQNAAAKNYSQQLQLLAQVQQQQHV